MPFLFAYVIIVCLLSNCSSCLLSLCDSLFILCSFLSALLFLLSVSLSYTHQCVLHWFSFFLLRTMFRREAWLLITVTWSRACSHIASRLSCLIVHPVRVQRSRCDYRLLANSGSLQERWGRWSNSCSLKPYLSGETWWSSALLHAHPRVPTGSRPVQPGCCLHGGVWPQQSHLPDKDY